jgi:hypothetical protein
MGEYEVIRRRLYEAIGEEGCGTVCSDADIFHDEDGWKLQLEGFMEPWKIGKTVEEAERTIKELARMRFGLSS